MQEYPYQPLLNIAALLAEKGIRHVVVSPGSRSAPLTLGIAREKRLQSYIISDERSAAFIGLGLALSTRQPVALVCTSGTAGLNYAPAIAEAFYQQVPLVVLTADRPPEWIDQQDGQSIRQQNLFGAHVKAAWQSLPDPTHAASDWHLNRIVNEAVNLSRAYPPGPVHLNIPIREPFYPQSGQTPTPPQAGRVIRESRLNTYLEKSELQHYARAWRSSGRILLVAGQEAFPPTGLAQTLDMLQVPILTDISSNLYKARHAIGMTEALLAHPSAAEMRADLVVSFGQSVLSKSLKTFLRKAAPAAHWHIQPAGAVADPFQCLTDIVRAEPQRFFQQLFTEAGPAADTGWLGAWLKGEQVMRQRVQRFFADQDFSEFQAVHQLMETMGKQPGFNLHLANSMSVRYANYVGAHAALPDQVFSNRGTSGIDGSLSTAVGVALGAPERQNILITGDLAFFYDRNGLWHNYLPPNLKIFLLNNHGGVIFRLIDGPGNLPELEEFFETRQPLNASAAARQHDLPFFAASDKRGFQKAFKQWWETSGPALMEVSTLTTKNKKVFDAFKKALASE